MSKRIKILDKVFELRIPEEEILHAVERVASDIRRDYSGKNPVFVVVLNGAFVFASDLLRLMDFPCQFAFTKLSSYQGTSSTGKIVEVLPVVEDITDRHVIIVEDIIDTGYTIEYLIHCLKKRHPASIEVCTLSHKPEKCKVNGLHVKYVGMTLPEAFIVGYGLDYDNQGRELRDIYSLVED